MNKLDKLKIKYKGITFETAPFNKSKILWKWNRFSSVSKKSEIEDDIKKEIEGYLKFNCDVPNPEFRKVLGRLLE